MKLLRLILNNLPRSAKFKFARKIGSISFLLRRLVGFHYFDKYLLWLYLKVNDLEKAEKIISDHKNDLNYCRYLLDVERRKSFGKEAQIWRLDYKEEDSTRIIKLNQELIQRFPEDVSLQQNMARNFVASGCQDQARFYFFESLKLQRKQKLKDGKTGLIFIAGGHRSGTGFTAKSLTEGFKIKDNAGSLISRYDEYFPKYGIVQVPSYLNSHDFSAVADGVDGVMGTHAGAIEANLKTLPLITDKILVIIRDIRQSVVSKVAYSEYLRNSGNITGLLQYQYPDGFFHWPIDKKIDWQIDNYYVPADIEWISGWLKTDADPDFPCEIHFSKFEDLVHNPKKYFQDILSFYGLPEEKFTYPKKPRFKPKTHMRKGLTDEWREVLNKEQIQKINALIPEAWFDRFNWPIK